MPKSMIRTGPPPSSTMMFWGLRSRWTMPCACASPGRWRSDARMDTARPAGIWPILRNEPLEVLAVDVLHRDVRRALGPAMSNMRQTFLWTNLAGRLELVAEALDVSVSAAISGRRSFRATFSLSSVSRTL